MKLTILRVVCILLLVGVIGLYVYGIAVQGDAPTDNLARTVVIAISAISALMKLTPKRQPLNKFAQAYAKELGNAFQDQPHKREKLLEAARLYNENKFPAALKALDALRPVAVSGDERYAVGLFTALSQSELGLNDAVIATYEGMVAQGLGTSQVYSNLAHWCMEAGQIEKAAEAAFKAVELNPENSKAHVNLGNILLQMGDCEEAGQEAALACELEPQMYQAWTLRAITCAIQGDEDGKTAAFQQAIKTGQDANALERAIAHFMGLNVK